MSQSSAEFLRASLPPEELRPEFIFTLPELDYPARMNSVSWFVDRWVEAGEGGRPAVETEAGRITYAALKTCVDRLAHALQNDFGVGRGDRILIFAANNDRAAAAILAVMKCGAVAVPVMSLLRAGELAHPLNRADIRLALCDERLRPELEKAKALAPALARIVTLGSSELESAMAKAPAHLPAADTAAEDICLIAFTSGTTGAPKGTMHNHRDLRAVCDSYGRHVLKARGDDRFIGSPPLAFTFGLGGHLLFPFAVGAVTILIEKLPPPDMLAAIKKHKATVCFTAPTAYRAMLGLMRPGDTASLRKCVSAGEALPLATFEAWKKATGLELMDGIGSTEMLHIFIGSPEGDIRPGATGRVVPGYEAKIIDAEGNDCADGTPGRLAVRGPTGCRYLNDERQRVYVKRGWNITGDTYIRDADGYFWYQARSDDMIVSAGYNISGPDVETALMSHAAVRECGVVAAPDAERGAIVKAYVVLNDGCAADAAQVKALQDHVKAAIAPYKYPRAVEFVKTLPRTPTGKLQRGELRARAARPVPLTLRRSVNPPGWPQPKGYANAIVAQGRQIFTGGQIGWNEKGEFPSGFVDQAAQTFRNIAAVLKAAGAGPQHLVRLTWYVRGMELYRANLPAIGKAYRESLGPHYPAMALVEVVSLVEREALIEIEATAVMGE